MNIQFIQGYLNQLHKPVHAVIQVKITIQGFQCGCFSVIPHRGILGRGIGFGIPSPSETACSSGVRKLWIASPISACVWAFTRRLFSL